jgi:hypothetical protein
MPKEGITISELMDATGLRRNTIEVRLHRLGIKPLSYEAIYPPDTLDKIQAITGPGRPKKPKPQEPPSKSPPKTSKNES